MVRLLKTTVTSLDLERPETGFQPPALPEGDRLEEAHRMAPQRYRALYRTVGDPHHWTSRLLSDDNLKREIHAPSTRVFVLHRQDRAAGWFELEVRDARREVRIVHFAIMPGFRGQGLSHLLLDHAISASFGLGAQRVIIETNTLDHPAALGLYKGHGFVPFATREVRTPAIEEDPSAGEEAL